MMTAPEEHCLTLTSGLDIYVHVAYFTQAIGGSVMMPPGQLTSTPLPQGGAGSQKTRCLPERHTTHALRVKVVAV